MISRIAKVGTRGKKDVEEGLEAEGPLPALGRRRQKAVQEGGLWSMGYTARPVHAP